MESSKSEETKAKQLQDSKIVVENDQPVAKILDTNVEREIQNILINGDVNEPTCSTAITGQVPQTGNKIQIVGPAKCESSSSVSISMDVNCPPYKENLKQLQEDILQPKKAHEETQSIDVEESLINLFDGLEVTRPQEPPVTNPSVLPPPVPHQRVQPVHQRVQSPVTHQRVPPPPVTHHRAQSPNTNRPNGQYPPISQLRASQSPIMSQPRSHSLTYPRGLEPLPNTSRGIHVVNFPNESINRALQRETRDLPSNIGVPRGDQILGPPPSYSKSLLDRRINPCASIQFVAPIPPPSYDGMESELRYAQTLGHTPGFTLGLGNTWQGQPQPAYCPVCETVIITQIEVRVSRIAHIVAMVMFLLLLWPFCLLPYFLNVCNYTFHYCSICHSYLGARRPFQRG